MNIIQTLKTIMEKIIPVVDVLLEDYANKIKEKSNGKSVKSNKKTE